SRNRVTPSASHRLRTCTGGTRAGGRNSVTSSPVHAYTGGTDMKSTSSRDLESSPHLHGRHCPTWTPAPTRGFVSAPTWAAPTQPEELVALVLRLRAY